MDCILNVDKVNVLTKGWVVSKLTHANSKQTGLDVYQVLGESQSRSYKYDFYVG